MLKIRNLTTLAMLAALAVGLAACSSSDGGPSQAELDAARQAAAEAEAAAERAAEEARQVLIAEQQKAAVMDAVAAATASVAALMDGSSDVDVAEAMADIAAATAAIAAATTLSAADMATYNAQVTAIQASLALAQANIRAYRAEMAANQANQDATAADRAKTAVEDAIAALNAAETAEAMAEAANVQALAALTAAQADVTNAEDSDALTAASAALATALMDASTAEADLGVKTQAVADATNALEMARTKLAEADPDHVALQAANAALDKAKTDAEEQATRIKALEDQIAALRQAEQDRQDAADAKAEEERMMQMAADGKALLAALGETPLGNLHQVTLSATGLLISTDDGGTDDDVTLMAGDSAGSLGMWGGMHYAHMNAGTKVSNAAVVYTNQADPKMMPFGEVHTDTLDTVTGYVAATRTLTLATSQANSNIMASKFPTAGSQNIPPDVSGGTDVSFPGTYDGVDGTYLCTTANATTGCSAQYTANGITLTNGTWTFVHAAGAMVPVSDPDYLYFGWWLTKDKDGMPTSASAFTGTVGTAPTALTGVTSIAGSATYTGSAAGKFAIYNPLDTTGEAGHFTADATLTAKFSGTGAGISGTIDNFMANDKSEPWSVALNNTDTDSAAGTPTSNITESGAIEAIEDNTDTPDVNEAMSTVWSIDGNSAAASGTWNGQMYDEAQGDDDDGSNIPTTVLGSFSSEFGSIGRMVGAFGATN